MTTRMVIWQLLLYRPWHAMAAVFSWLLISLVPVGLGLISRNFFDALSGDAPDAISLWVLAALPLVMQSVRLLTTWITVPLNVVHRFSLMTVLSGNLLRQILRRPGAEPLPYMNGDVISRFRDDVDEVATFVTIQRLLSGVGEAVTAVVSVTVMLLIDARVTAAALLPLLAVVLVARAAGGRVGQYRSHSRTATGQVTGFLSELFGAALTIKLAGTDEQAATHLDRLNQVRQREAVKDRLFEEMLRSIYVNTGNLGTGLVVLLASGAIRAGSFSVGDFALFAAFLSRVALFAGVIGDLVAKYRQVQVALGRLTDLMGVGGAERLAHRPTGDDAVDGGSVAEDEGLIRLDVRGLTYLYPGSGKGISGVDLALERGSITVVTGRVGSGKTTLLQVLLGLLSKQAGEIRWNGDLITDAAAHFIPPRSSYTAQVPVLFSETIRENILQGVPDNQADMAQAIWSGVLEEEIDSLTEGLDTVIGPRGMRLSGGQAQRTAAARMFVRKPKLLVFDDLSSALDVDTEMQLWHRLRRRPELTCLAVSTRRAALQVADQIIVLKDGEVEATGRWEELLADSVEFRAIWEGELAARSA